MGSEEKRYALLIDSDNVSAKYIDTIFDELADRGMVTVRRIYGDWARSVNGWNRTTLLRNSIVPIQQFAYTQGKNATDSAMIIDAMDLLYTHRSRMRKMLRKYQPRKMKTARILQALSLFRR